MAEQAGTEGASWPSNDGAVQKIRIDQDVAKENVCMPLSHFQDPSSCFLNLIHNTIKMWQVELPRPIRLPRLPLNSELLM